MPNDNVLTARVADLLHLLEFATIHTPTEGDGPQIIDAIRDIKAFLAAHPGQPEPIAWESTTTVYTKYITDSRYQKFSPEVRKWYKPYRCSACTEPRAEVTDKGIAAVDKLLRSNAIFLGRAKLEQIVDAARTGASS